MKYAAIEGNLVVSVSLNERENFIPVPDSVFPGFTIDDEGNFSEPIQPIEERKEEMLLVLEQEHANILKNLTGNATIEERDTWQAKALASEAIVAGTATEGQIEMISTEAQLSGKELNSLVQTVLERNYAFMKMIGIAAGHRSATKDLIMNASSHEELDTISTNSRAQAQNLIQEYLAAVAEASGAQNA